jgi:hypothetical protein
MKLSGYFGIRAGEDFQGEGAVSANPVPEEVRAATRKGRSAEQTSSTGYS